MSNKLIEFKVVFSSPNTKAPDRRKLVHEARNRMLALVDTLNVRNHHDQLQLLAEIEEVEVK